MPGPVASLRLNFDQPMDSTTFSVADDVVFSGPQGPVTPTGFTWVDGQTLEVTFEPQAAAGHYQMLIGPEIRNTVGNAMDQDRDFLTGEYPDDRYEAEFTVLAPRIVAHAPSGTLTDSVGAICFTFDQPMDQMSFSLAEDVASFDGPGGPIVPVGFTWIDVKTLEVTFDHQWAAGEYRMVVGPQILNTAGNAMDQDRDYVAGEILNDQYAAAFTILAPRVLGLSPDGTTMGPVDQVCFSFDLPMDQGSFSDEDLVINGPHGLIPITGHEWVDPRTLCVMFAAQPAVGDYHLTEEFRGGDDVLTQVDPTWYFREPGGGPLYDVTVYSLHGLTGILGPAKRVAAVSGLALPEREFGGKMIECDMDDSTFMLLDFGESVFALVYGTVAGSVASGFHPSIFGTKGSVVGTKLNDEEMRKEGDHEPHVVGGHAKMAESHVFEDMMQLVDWVRDGTPSIATAEHARHVIDIFESGYRAAETGETQELGTSFTPG